MLAEKIKVLYIEDDDASAKVTKEFLNRSSFTEFTVIRKKTLADGIEFLNTKCVSRDSCDVDVVLLDLVLPNSHGVATFKSVRDVCSFLPIIIISAHTDIACKCVGLGAQDYLVKPNISAQTLVRSINYSIERKKAEEKIICQNNHIKKRDKEYRSTMDALQAGVVVHGGIMEIILSNPAAEEILGLTFDQLTGKKPFHPEWRFVHEDLTTVSLEDYPSIKVFESGEPLINYIVGIDRPDREYITWVIFNATPVFSNNKMEKIIVNFIDITAQRQAEEELNKREREVYAELNKKINIWKDEIAERVETRDRHLSLINGELLSLNSN